MWRLNLSFRAQVFGISVSRSQFAVSGFSIAVGFSVSGLWISLLTHIQQSSPAAVLIVIIFLILTIMIMLTMPITRVTNSPGFLARIDPSTLRGDVGVSEK